MTEGNILNFGIKDFVGNFKCNAVPYLYVLILFCYPVNDHFVILKYKTKSNQNISSSRVIFWSDPV